MATVIAGEQAGQSHIVQLAKEESADARCYKVQQGAEGKHGEAGQRRQVQTARVFFVVLCFVPHALQDCHYHEGRHVPAGKGSREEDLSKLDTTNGVIHYPEQSSSSRPLTLPPKLPPEVNIRK